MSRGRPSIGGLASTIFGAIVGAAVVPNVVAGVFLATDEEFATYSSGVLASVVLAVLSCVGVLLPTLVLLRGGGWVGYPLLAMAAGGISVTLAWFMNPIAFLTQLDALLGIWVSVVAVLLWMAATPPGSNDGSGLSSDQNVEAVSLG